MYIYIITNKINKKQYVGQSINDPENPGGRLYQHFSLLAKGCAAIHNAIKKYSRDTFSYEVIHYPGASQEALNAIEDWKIKSLNTLSPNGYNLREGGAKGNLTADHKKKIGNANRNKTMSLDARKKISEARKKQPCPRTGKTHSKQSRKKMSQNRTERNDLWDNKEHIYYEKRILNISYTKLGKKYSCSPKTIYRIIKSVKEQSDSQ